MNSANFLQDLTIVLLIAAVVLLIFKRLGQPPVLGYIAAGLIIGPYTPPMPLLKDSRSLEALADIGVVFLLFALGVEFNLKRLSKVAGKAFVCAGIEALLLLLGGCGVGTVCGWSSVDSLLLGGVIALASTAIVARTLMEHARKNLGWEDLVAGKLIAEDMIAVLLIAFFSLSHFGDPQLSSVFSALGRLAMLMTVLLVGGLLLLPSVLGTIEKSGMEEIQTLSIIGICFGVALMTERLGFSAGLGAFLAGTMASLSSPGLKLHGTVAPFKDLFGGVFFVSVGMLIDPKWLLAHWPMALGLALLVVVARILVNLLALIAVGLEPVKSTQASLAMLPIGEFSFILAQLSQQQGISQKPIYPLAVMLCLATTLGSSLLFPKTLGDPKKIQALFPASLNRILDRYRDALLRLESPSLGAWRLIGPSFVQIVLNFAGISALFLAARTLQDRYSLDMRIPGVVWTIAAFFSLPFLNAMLRKTRAIASILLEVLSMQNPGEESPYETRPVLTQFFLGLVAVGVTLWYLGISLNLLPPWPYTLLPLGLIVAAGAILWRKMNRFYTKIQVLLKESLEKGAAEPETATAALSHFAAALAPEKVHIEDIYLSHDSWAIERSIRDIELRAKTGASILQINRKDYAIPSPGADTLLKADDELLLIGERQQIAKAKHLLKTGQL